MKAETNGHWERVRTESGPELILFRSRYDWLRNPRTRRELKAVVLESADWVNVVARTHTGSIVCVRQYRFGTGQETTEVPAGMVEPGETPAEAIKRELLEETGYTSAHWTYLGWTEPNPAFLNNRCHLWLAAEAERTAEPRPEDGEDIRVVELSPSEIQTEIAAGRLRHSLALLALGQVLELRGKLAAERKMGAE